MNSIKMRSWRGKCNVIQKSDPNFKAALKIDNLSDETHYFLLLVKFMSKDVCYNIAGHYVNILIEQKYVLLK